MRGDIHQFAEISHPVAVDLRSLVRRLETNSRRAMQVDPMGSHVAGNFAMAEVLLKKLLKASCVSCMAFGITVFALSVSEAAVPGFLENCYN